MKASTILALLQKSTNTVDVQFKTHNGEAFGHKYTYKTDLKLEAGDEVIINSPSSGLTVVVVSEVHGYADLDAASDIEYRWVVSKVSTDAYFEREEKEAALVKELTLIQNKRKHVGMVNELKESLGFAHDETSEELEALLVKINS